MTAFFQEAVDCFLASHPEGRKFLEQLKPDDK
jgi:hypothetical protein